jgi:cation diffusion facilitator family transporter
MTENNASCVDTAVKTNYFSIFSNLTLAVIKAIAGILGRSYALIADAIESTADIFSSLLVLFGLKYANRPADENHPYGHGRAEPLITFLVASQIKKPLQLRWKGFVPGTGIIPC